MNSLFCFAYARVAFALPIKPSLSQSLSFLTFTLPTLFPIPAGGSEQEAAWGLAAGGG